MEHPYPDDPHDEEGEDLPEDLPEELPEDAELSDSTALEFSDSQSFDPGSFETGLSADDTGDETGNAVLAANHEFYRSLEALDIERMEGIWLHADWVSCVHPGWPMLTGWEPVRESWKNIFDNTETIRFDLANLGVRVENATAWVTCMENILHLSSSGVAGASAVATNIFIRTPDGWKLALHHASPIPDSGDGE